MPHATGGEKLDTVWLEKQVAGHGALHHAANLPARVCIVGRLSHIFLLMRLIPGDPAW